MKQKARLADARQFWITLLIVSGTFIQGAFGIHVAVSGGDGIESSSVGFNIEALKESTVNSQVTVNGASITPTTRIIGPVSLFEETHGVKDSSGKSASVYVKVVNAANGLTYDSKVVPKEGSVSTRTFVSAEQWLTVPKADSIKCTATASYGTRSYDVGLEESKGLAVGDYVTLNGYYGKAYSSGTSLYASQTAADGSANSIKIYGHSKDSDGVFSVDTAINGISGAKASFTGLNSESTKGTTKVSQKEHILGSFTSTAKAGTKTITRTSNYGSEYDLDMQAKKGPSVSGTVGYYVNPATSANKIQGAVNAAQASDIINIAAGTYKEKVKIDKSLTINGAGSGKTIVDGSQAGTVATVNSGNVALNGLTITNGKATNGAGIVNGGTLTMNDVSITGNTATNNAGGIYNAGVVNFNSGSIDHNSGSNVGGGVYNDGTFNMNAGSISNNNAYYGAGIYSWKTINMNGGTISSNTGYQGCGIYSDGVVNMYGGSIDHNVADGKAGGLYIDGAGQATVDGGTISYNTADVGGGIYNDGVMTLKSGSIVNNKAGYGGGMYNWGTANLNGGSINQNTANNYGGGIYNDMTINVNGGSISYNSAPNGGGIYSSGTANLNSGTISYNTGNVGGGIFNDGTMTLKSGSIVNNKADYGGGVYNFGIANLNGGSINQNTANNYGGGIYSDMTVNVNGGSITYNTAPNGGGIYNSGGTVQLNSGSISYNTGTSYGGGIFNTGGKITGNTGIVHNNIPSQIVS